ncbi:putative E3 ubiquitin-protein ligase XBOS33 [Platanthera zijinensis]|uniref:E3 ubiquitin-protein ligase XBOS33 n=1 Tax=Platanthera zijinensis TaxID=2320716 RepID=A0AAP0G2V7_9ASPA
MAVPARRNELDEHDEGDGGLFEDEEEAWADPYIDVPPHLRPLADAAKSGDVNALRVALDNHVGSIDDPIEDGDSVLHLCCLYGSLSCVRLLLERGANSEVKDEEGAIPLHDACAGGYTEIVEFLINSAGNSSFVKRTLETTDTEGDTPLHHAARGEHLNVVQLLLSMGASPLVTNISGKTPAELADPGTNARRVLDDAAAPYSMVSQ